jgi:endoglucanase
VSYVGSPRRRLRGARFTALIAAGAAAAALAGTGAAASATPAAAKAVPAQVRVNQVGYSPLGDKVAFAMLPAKVSAVRFAVVGKGLVYVGRSADDLGGWNSRYGAVYELNFTGLHQPGTYRISVSAGRQRAESPAFKIASSGTLYHQLVLNGVRYFTSERDGADVDHSVLSREPANLADEHAYVYKSPRFDDNDNLVGKLVKIGGPVNVSGGWFDAGGGYEKFAYTASYADGLLLLADRDFPGKYPTIGPEAMFGLRWLEKLWNPARKVLYMQVGIGDGNASNTIQGDYNFWFLPQAEDKLNVSKGGNPGPTAFYVRYRPVLEAAPPGQKIDPDFAGRFAADFGLAAQLYARTNPPLAKHLLKLARSVFAMAKTTNVRSIITAYPHDFYPGTEWKSDLLWGADEIVLADEALHFASGQVSVDLKVAARWARAYIAQGHPAGGDTLNLYDTGALGEADLLTAQRGANEQLVPLKTVLGDLAAQLKVGEEWAKGDPFKLGTDLGPADASPHAFGLYITNALYEANAGGSTYHAFAQQQLNYALGANPWGTTFTVGAGSTYPHCMQSEIANLAGSLTGKGNIQLGATTDGPSSAGNFVGLGTVSGMRACRAGNFGPFSTKTVGYEDNVVSWPSVEPADDYTANSVLAFALAAAFGSSPN